MAQSTGATDQFATIPRGHFEALYRATVTGLARSFEVHVPDCAYRDLATWALTCTGKHHERFAQIFGVNQLAVMTTLLLGRVVTTDEAWGRIIPLSAVINAWLTHEVVSDNLAIGLGFPGHLDDPAMAVRRGLIYRFNQNMDRALGKRAPAGGLERHPTAEPFACYDARISIFSNMLAPKKYRALAAVFAGEHDVDPQSIERCVSSALCANILSCSDTVAAIGHPHLQSLVRGWIQDRYRSVTHLMQSKTLRPAELVEHGTRTILVAPTLGFYCFALAHAGGRAARMTPEIVFGPLEEALRAAATRVRLLNDLGTPLLLCSKQERHELLRGLVVDHSSDTLTLADALTTIELPSMTRLAKDALFKETNVGLHGLATQPLTDDSWRRFMARFDEYAELYRQARDTMAGALVTLASDLGDERYGLMIETFVEFHEHIYRQPYHLSTGEYAI